LLLVQALSSAHARNGIQRSLGWADFWRDLGDEHMWIGEPVIVEWSEVG
jgi:hypothetical protein